MALSCDTTSPQLRGCTTTANTFARYVIVSAIRSTVPTVLHTAHCWPLPREIVQYEAEVCS
jgi:hypothetical protein